MSKSFARLFCFKLCACCKNFAFRPNIVELFDLKINTYEKALDINQDECGFRLRTQTLRGEHEYQANQVIIVKGDMDKPNLLNIPGEALPHVSHYFDDPRTYFRKRLLIVGGCNSAAEAALRCWRAGAHVSISYRNPKLSERVKHFILPDLQAQIDNGNIGFYPQTLCRLKLRPTVFFCNPLRMV